MKRPTLPIRSTSSRVGQQPTTIWGVLALTVASCLLSPATADAQQGNPFRKDRVDRAVNRAVKFLLNEQHAEGRLAGAINEGQQQRNLTAMTALSIIAMAAVGHQPADPTPEGKAMRAGLDYVLQPSNQRRGYYFGADGSRMYGHGITTLMLGEMLGMGVSRAQEVKIRQRLKKAVHLILASQQVEKNRRHWGGWRYTPDATDSDLSVTVWQVMALRSAKNAGLQVPPESIEAAVSYIRRCYQRRKNGFGYQPGSGTDYAMVAAGMLSMQLCGEYEAKEVIGAADWLLQRKLRHGHHWFFYGTYYYAQGMYQRRGEHALKARRRVEEILLPNQSDDGSWVAAGGQEQHVGRVYSTAMAVLSLSVKYHYLPIYQR